MCLSLSKALPLDTANILAIDLLIIVLENFVRNVLLSVLSQSTKAFSSHIEGASNGWS